MAKTINFRTVIYPYDKVVDSIVTPITKHLSQFSINYNYLENYLNVSFFIEMEPHGGAFISHGIADKNWRNANRVHDYDYIFVSGPAWKDKLINQGIAPEKILINGYPRLDTLFNQEKPVRKNNKINLLFAPTHTMMLPASLKEDPIAVKNVLLEEVSANETLLKSLGEIPDDINLIESRHPANNRYNMTFDQYLIADVVISDCSSTLYEAWALGIPVVFPDWLVKDNIIKKYPNSFEEYIYTNSIGYHAQSANEMLKMIYIAKESGVDEQTKEFMEGIFPIQLRGNSGSITAKMLLDAANI